MNIKDAKALIDFIRKEDLKLNEWQTDFLKSIEYKVKMGYQLTIPQSRALNKLYSDAVGGGVYQQRQRI